MKNKKQQKASDNIIELKWHEGRKGCKVLAGSSTFNFRNIIKKNIENQGKLLKNRAKHNRWLLKSYKLNN